VPARRPLQSVRSAPEGSKALGGRGGGPDAMPTLGLEKSVRPSLCLGGTLVNRSEAPPLPAPARLAVRRPPCPHGSASRARARARTS
jgi:hypothetical protein